MKYEVVMPKMGESVNEGTIIKWHKKVGDKVDKDEILFEISTDKVDTEIPAVSSGFLSEIKVFEQETVQVNTVVAIIDSEGVISKSDHKNEVLVSDLSTNSNQNIVNIIMPKMGESVMTGTILKWHKKVGDKVEKDETLFEISTDKVDTEVPSAVSGFLVEILFNEQATVDVGTVVGKINPTEYIPVFSEKKNESISFNNEGKNEKTLEKTSSVKSDKESNKFYSPLVMNIASKENVTYAELESIEGTGLNGRVTKNDILKYIELKKKRGQTSNSAPEEMKSTTPVIYEPKPVEKVFPSLINSGVETIPMDNMRQIIMNHMVKSRDTSVHVMGVQEADMTKIEQFINKNKAEFFQRENVKLTYMPFIISAVIKAIKDFPFLNASIDGANIIKKSFINIGMAVALEPMGLIVPVIKNADEKNIVGLAKAINDLGTRARNKKLTADEVKDSTFTITNYGVFGTLFGNPIINQPEVAILGIGSVTKKPVVVEFEGIESIGIRSMMYLSLSHDHRLVDGALAGRFLNRVKEYLENFDHRLN